MMSVLVQHYQMVLNQCSQFHPTIKEIVTLQSMQSVILQHRLHCLFRY